MTPYIQLFLLILLDFISQLSQAQTYKVQVVLTVVSPYSSKLSDFIINNIAYVETNKEKEYKTATMKNIISLTAILLAVTSLNAQSIKIKKKKYSYR